MRNPAESRSPWLLVLSAVLIAVLAMNCYRARVQSITIDEAFSYFNFVSAPFGGMLEPYDANNHILNSLLAKVTTRIFGVSELTLRLPSLLGGALFLFATQRFLLPLFSQGWFASLTYCAVVLNPIVLDYLSAARRGYSLALGFQYCALWLLTTKGKPARNWIAGACLGLSVASNLTFILPNALVVCAWLAINYRKAAGFLQRAVAMIAAYVATAALFLALPLRHATLGNFYVGEASAGRSLAIMLSRSFAFPDFGFGYTSAAVLIRTAPAVLLYGLLIALVLLIAGRRPTLLAPLVFGGSIAALLALHLFFGLPYPYERTGLYLIPLATISLALSANLWIVTGRAKILARIWEAIVCLFLAAIVFQYAIELKVNRYEEWAFDAGTKRALLKLREIRRGQPRPEHLGVSWVFEQSVNWYREVYRWDWLQPVSRADPRQIAFDSYYLTHDDLDIAGSRHLTVVYTDPVSGSVLAIPSVE